MPRLRRPSLAVVVSLLVAAAFLLGGWVWLRDSSLVAVESVTVTGASGLGAPAVRSSLTGAAQQMTTLNVDRGALNAVVARFPLVKGISVKTDFPHGMAIVVYERRPVAALVGPGGALAVAADGV
ncbi:MAG: FtsQ-type POTRA domain-containing protein, partial [Solirubrobacteraceae bacterium]|nr:FtsQ-type POTRA domain-containing protein [Solirubrobacteraceae bacterium]